MLTCRHWIWGLRESFEILGLAVKDAVKVLEVGNQGIQHASLHLMDLFSVHSSISQDPLYLQPDAGTERICGNPSTASKGIFCKCSRIPNNYKGH